MRSYFEVEGKKVYPVETSSYQTVNLSTDENIILATAGLSGCYAILIKSRDVATMVHMNPQNFIGLGAGKDKNIVGEIYKNVSSNLQLALQDFFDKGGDKSKTVISIYGGLINAGYVFVLENYFKSQNFRCKVFSDSQNKAQNPDEITAYSNVFVTKESVMVTRTFDRVQLNAKYHNHILIKEASIPRVSSISALMQSIMQQTSIDFVDLEDFYANYCLERSFKLVEKQKPLRLVNMNKIFENIQKQREMSNFKANPIDLEFARCANKVSADNEKLNDTLKEVTNDYKDDSKDENKVFAVKPQDRSNNIISQSNPPVEIIDQKKSDDSNQTSYDYMMIGAICSVPILLFYLWYKYSGAEASQDIIVDESWTSMVRKGYEGEKGL